MVRKLDKKIGFIGGGNMAEAIIRGLLDAALCLVSNISVSDVRKERLELLRHDYGVNVFAKNEDCVDANEVIVLLHWCSMDFLKLTWGGNLYSPLWLV